MVLRVDGGTDNVRGRYQVGIISRLKKEHAEAEKDKKEFKTKMDDAVQVPNPVPGPKNASHPPYPAPNRVMGQQDARKTGRFPADSRNARSRETWGRVCRGKRRQSPSWLSCAQVRAYRLLYAPTSTDDMLLQVLTVCSYN